MSTDVYHLSVEILTFQKFLEEDNFYQRKYHFPKKQLEFPNGIKEIEQNCHRNF